VIAKNLPMGHVITEADITYKRPGTGVSPLRWDEVIGMRTKKALSEDDVLTWDDLVG
jgi:sialic acid synthase SpsE